MLNCFSSKWTLLHTYKTEKKNGLLLLAAATSKIFTGYYMFLSQEFDDFSLEKCIIESDNNFMCITHSPLKKQRDGHLPGGFFNIKDPIGIDV